MNRYFAYIRVSTVKQGEKGSSLSEQRSAIEAFARRHDLHITQWFEEKETAAKGGRPQFTSMLKALNRGSANGLVIHKIDRSARNLRDWAAIGELIDRGVAVHFAHESLDMNSRGGRLAADIQAVVAADFIRNLRDEVKKGFYGRLKQGLYPLGAPIGYLDQGGGRAKTIDPVRGPLVAKCFELYATGRWPLIPLRHEMERRGLRTRVGKPVGLSGLSVILNNPFYIGLIRLKKTGERFQGMHTPLVDKFTFDRVQAILHGRLAPRSRAHQFRYSRSVRCGYCRLSLIGERQKGHVYYRCHNQTCPTTCLAERLVDDTLGAFACRFSLETAEWKAIEADAATAFVEHKRHAADDLKALSLAIAAIDSRSAALTDALIDGMIDRASYASRNAKLLDERAWLLSRRSEIETGDDATRRRVERILELIEALGNLPNLAKGGEMRDLILETTSNFSVRGKEVVVQWKKPFDRLIIVSPFQFGPLDRGSPRTEIVKEIVREAIRGEFEISMGRDNYRRPKKPHHPGLKNILQFNEQRLRRRDAEAIREAVEEQDNQDKPPSDLAA